MKKIGVVEWIVSRGFRKKILADEKVLGQKGCLAQIVSVAPGDEVKPHYHKIQTELNYILQGNGILFFNKERIRTQPGDVIICEPGDIHGVINDTRDDFQFIVFKTNFVQNDIYWEAEP